jgi:signal transduction histidine kinase
MKLLNKTIVYYLLFSLPVFAVCSVFIYQFISIEIKDELDENLWKEKTETEHKLANGIDPEMIASNEIIISKYSDNKFPPDTFSDTSLFNEDDKEILPYRVLNAYSNVNGQSYALTIRQSYVESDDLISSILVPIVSMFIFLLIGFLFINYWISRKLWTPFYKTIEKLKLFKLGHDKSLQFPPESIKEFNELNSSLTIMTEKAYSDYIHQKEFTENASHEIQTPLAIIQNKIELLIQSKRLAEGEMKLISDIHDSASRLSRLNKSLLLLTKIENYQFKDKELVNLNSIINKYSKIYEDQIVLKQIKITTNFVEESILQIDPILCEMLFSNLMLNAIKHNITGGVIHMELYKNKFIITNTGNPLSITSEQLFERFKKDTSSSDSVGLGLSIVLSICKLYSIDIIHSYNNSKHTFTLNWK